MSFQRARGILRFVALVVTAYFSADISMAIVGNRLTQGTPVASASAPPATVGPRRLRSSFTYYSTPIQERNLFGQVTPKTAAATNITEVQDSTLEQKVVLVGTVVADDPALSTAVIEDKTSRLQDVYCIGSPESERWCTTNIEEAKVHAIERECVVFSRGEAKEKLCMPKGDEKGKGPVRAAAASIVTPPSAANAGGYMPSPDAIQKLDENTYRVDGDEVKRAMENLPQLFTQIRAVPNFQNGKTDGFRLFSIKKDSIFDKMGLRNGDVVRKVGDTEVNSPEVALQLFQDLRNARDVSMEVTRNDRNQALSYQVR